MPIRRKLFAAPILAPLLLLAGCPGTCSPAPPAAPQAQQAAEPADLGSPTPAGLQFFEDFRTPSGFYDRFVTQVHHRANDFSSGATWPGEHNMACEGPTTTRPVHSGNHAEMFWWCAPNGPDSGHVMTSMGAVAGYSVVSFAPNRTFQDVNSVCWDISLTVLDRQWFEVLVIPEAAFQANGGRLDYVSPPVEVVDDTAGRIGPGAVLFQQELQGAPQLFVGREMTFRAPSGYRGTDPAPRFKHCITDNGNGTIAVEQHHPGGVIAGSGQGRFPDGPVRVIFKSHSYDPGKGGGADHGTWHWDNIQIA